MTHCVPLGLTYVRCAAFVTECPVQPASDRRRIQRQRQRIRSDGRIQLMGQLQVLRIVGLLVLLLLLMLIGDGDYRAADDVAGAAGAVGQLLRGRDEFMFHVARTETAFCQVEHTMIRR